MRVHHMGLCQHASDLSARMARVQQRAAISLSSATPGQEGPELLAWMAMQLQSCPLPSVPGRPLHSTTYCYMLHPVKSCLRAVHKSASILSAVHCLPACIVPKDPDRRMINY